MSTNEGDVSLDLVATELVARRMRQIALISVGLGLLVVVIASFVVAWPKALLIGVVVGAPTAVSVLLLLRKKSWISGHVVHSRRALGGSHVDLAQTVSAEVVVRIGRIYQVCVRLGDGTSLITLPLALYVNDAGREIGALPLRRLADGLDASELVAAAAVASVLVQQLRAEARDAILGQRPLYRAVQVARDSGRTGETTLTDAEVASLLD